MQATQVIQLDAALCYQRAAIDALKSTLSITHGELFATNFISEHEQAVLLAAQKRLCGHSEDWLVTETLRLRTECGRTEDQHSSALVNGEGT